MKYWNKDRIVRVKQRSLRSKRQGLERLREVEDARTRHTPGDARKNAMLMLEALGSVRNRMMLARLRERGAMSVSNLAKPFRITLPAALNHVNMLERVGLILTHKRGRVRFCVYNPAAPKELSAWLSSRDPFGSE